MVQETAQLIIERALESKSRLSMQQLELEPGQLVDFWRKPATKDESGWRGPATVISIGDRGGEPSPATIQWQGSKLSVRTQDLRRSLVYFTALMLPASEHEDPRDLLVRFIDSMPRGRIVRVGWVRVDKSHPDTTDKREFHGGELSPTAWLRAKASAQHSDMLFAVLHVAACHLGLAGCIGARIGRGVSKLEGVADCSRTFIWWWRAGSPKTSWYMHPSGTGPIRLTDLFGAEIWTECHFVQFLIAADDDVNNIRLQEPGVPNIGGMGGLDRPPPTPPIPDSPMAARPSSASRSRSTESMRGPDSGEPSLARSEGELDDRLTGSDPESSARSAPASSARSRSARGGRTRSEPPSPSRPKRSRPSSLKSRGGVSRQRTAPAKQLTPGLPEEDVEQHTRPDPEAQSSSGPELPLVQPEDWQPPDAWGPWPTGPNDPHEGWDPGEDPEGPPGIE